MKSILNHLFEYKTLSKQQARNMLVGIARAEYNHAQISAFISVYLMRSITVAELEGFRDALWELCLPSGLESYSTIDLCGTGGDGKDTFNISTLASFVCAANGVQVAKHGNYGVSSACGSSNVMEFLGFNFSNKPDTLQKQLEACNITFLHAPLFHPALKEVGPIRKQLGVKTFFNMLGPLVNPAFPPFQMVGVFSLELARLYQYLFQQDPKKQYTIVHGLDGYDEVSLTHNFKMISNSGEKIMGPTHLGLKPLNPTDILGGDTVETSAKIFTQVLKGHGTEAQNTVVSANAALGMMTAKPEIPFETAYQASREALISGKAETIFKKLLTIQ